MKRKVTLYFMAIILITLSLVMIGFGVAIRLYYYNGIVNTFKNKAEITTPAWAKEIDFTNEKIADYSNEIINAYGFAGAELQLLDKRGMFIQSTTGFYRDKTYLVDRKLQSLDTVYKIINNKYDKQKNMIIYTPLVLDGEFVGILRYSVSLEKVNGLIKNLIGVGMIICVFVAVFVFLVSLQLGNSIVRPLEDITHFAKEMGEGHYKKRIEKKYSYEIGDLVDMLNHMGDEILKTDRLKNDFISSVSHELRTPLTGIKGWVETIRRPQDLSKEDFEFGLTVINNETDRLIGLVENLLDFSRYQSDRIKLAYTSVEIDKIIVETSFELQKKAENKQIELVVKTSPEVIEADGDRLRQVFLNIIDNAIKFSHKYSSVYIRQETKENGVLIEIKDTGIGMGQEHLEHIGESFYKINSKSMGAGLGLAISKNIIKLHGGVFEICSEYEKGTIVRIFLPKKGNEAVTSNK